MSDTDLQLVTIASTPIQSIADVVAVFEAIKSAVPESDGLHWFNWLYLTVTSSVGVSMSTLEWKNPAWLERLDIVFAGLYLKGLRKCLRQDADAPRCWQVFVNARHDTRLARIQFAMAGMNAHINLKTAVGRNRARQPVESAGVPTAPHSTVSVITGFCATSCR